MVATLFINGVWKQAADGGAHDVHSPHDQRVVATVSQATQDDVLDAISAARISFDSGVFTSWSFKERSALVAKIADLLERDADLVARKESDDTGKRFLEAQYDIADVIATFRHFAALGAKEHERNVDVGLAHVTSRIVHEPLGVASLIGPWNYPLLQIAWKVAPALVAGCSFIVKPSELTPQSAIALMKIIEEAGTPKGVANLILGPGSVVGTPLINDPRVDLVSFTGGLTTGQTIMTAAAKTIKKLALELGGKNPHIIFADADIDVAIDNAVTAAFLHSGQVCSAGTRLLVERSIHDRVVTEIVRRAAQIRLGGPDDLTAETGPLISQSHLRSVTEYVQKGIAEGATLLVGGKRSDLPEHASGWYFLPTVLDHCTTDMRCVQDESFGPVMTVEVFDTEAEAIALGNDTVFGLSGGLWSSDSAKAARVASALRHGTIWVNDFGPYRPAAEWGGYKQSGIGRELGEHGLGEYLEIKHIWTNNSPSRSGWFSDPT
ncbi:MAG: aldehyde dehydrogenase family protein [Actinomycetales bacterium]|nr:MAG: aldehyde dehydrogenase family protein [Actinomycetales bacterium]